MNKSLSAFDLSQHSQSSNDSCLLTSHAVWDLTSIFTLFQFFITLTVNTAVLLVFAVRRSLWTPFNVYLFNLLVANVLYCLTSNIFDVLHAFYPVFCFGRALCNLNMYGMWVVTLVQMLSHPLIALNRLWALWLPISYHNHLTIRTAVGLSGIVWLIAHCVALPGLIMDIAFYRQAEDQFGCNINFDASRGQKTWLILIQFFSMMCLLIVLAAYPLIYHKERHRKKVRSTKPTATPATEVSTNPVKRMSKEIAVTLSLHHNPRRSRAFLLLTVLTISVFINWTTGVFYYFSQPFTGYSNPILDSVTQYTFTIQVVADPVLFALALKSVRTAIIDIVCSCRA
ncbi:5-hydroxytryptamine receptor 1D-like [Paramacrobiotus metropolitanus]|uniref:5-hydroxytryptamine receptor 1D-like n=1 Tax=Paramacrobiotus metropolitanus TaxID=2943436 RepID=UPI002445C10A|nr:5-hydroxytryptamine receptor 1D-like [Paramacrobiotus metropolitanus]